MVCGLQKYTLDQARRRASVPKYQVLNNDLMSLYAEHDFSSARQDHRIWGRFVESAAGAYILNCAYINNFDVFYWREENLEVDFVLAKNSRIVAIEVKSNNEKDTAGLHAFEERFHPHRTMIVGEGGLSLENFLKSDLKVLFE